MLAADLDAAIADITSLDAAEAMLECVEEDAEEVAIVAAGSVFLTLCTAAELDPEDVLAQVVMALERTGLNRFVRYNTIH